MKVIVFNHPDKGASVVRPSPRFIREHDDWEELIRAKSVPEGATNIKVIDDSELPAYDDFRDAWRVDQGVAVDLDKAKTVWRERIRQARTAAFAKLDTAYMRADEMGDTAEKERIAARKQALRDLPADARIDTAKTTTDLRQVWESDLD